MFLFEERMSSSHPDLRICVWVVAVFVCTVFCKVDGYLLEHVPQRSLGVNGIFYFQADTPRFGIEMWRSDGTSSGTWLLKDIYNGTKSSTPSYFFECNTTLYFTAETDLGVELWSTDGTPSGTKMVIDICPGSGSSNPRDFTLFNGRMYFSADDCTHGRELWHHYTYTSGNVTTRVTEMKTDIFPGELGSDPHDFGVLVKAGDGTTSDPRVEYKMYFAANNTKTVITYLNEQGFPVNISNHQNLDSLEKRINITDYGIELWETNGLDEDLEAGITQVGGNITKLTQDISIGPGSSMPSGFTWYWDKLYFSAGDGINGRELWRVWKCVPYRFIENQKLVSRDCSDFVVEQVTQIGTAPLGGGVFMLTLFDDVFYFGSETGTEQDGVITLFEVQKKLEPYEAMSGIMLTPDVAIRPVPDTDEFSFEIVDAVLGGVTAKYRGQPITKYFGKSSYPENFATVWLNKLATGEQFAENPDKNLVEDM